MKFQGYRRADGLAGTRNTVLIIPSVGCSQEAARSIARGLKGVVYLPNILGCGQMGEDRHTLKRTLTGFGLNPNVAAVLIVGLGCEELAADSIAEEIRPSGKPVAKLVPADESTDDIYGFLAGKIAITGDIIAPALSLEEWGNLK